jgi:hypothetical protein
MQTGPNLRVTMFDFIPLYLSIDLEQRLNSLGRFLNTFCSEYQDTDLQDLVIILARSFLTHCFMKCPEISSNPSHQLIGTAMGTTYASFQFRQSTWIYLYRLLTRFDLRPTTSPVIRLHFFLWARFTYVKLSRSLPKPYFIWHLHIHQVTPDEHREYTLI